MIVKAIQCPKCKDIVYSRARHDLNWCACSFCFIDGGFDHIRVGGYDENLSKIKRVDIEVDATKQELYDDWNRADNEYGRIPFTPDTVLNT